MKRFGTTNRQLYRRPRHRTIAGVAAVAGRLPGSAALVGRRAPVRLRVGRRGALAATVELPAHSELLISSGELRDGLLPPDAAVWLRD